MDLVEGYSVFKFKRFLVGFAGFFLVVSMVFWRRCVSNVAG